MYAGIPFRPCRFMLPIPMLPMPGSPGYNAISSPSSAAWIIACTTASAGGVKAYSAAPAATGTSGCVPCQARDCSQNAMADWRNALSAAADGQPGSVRHHQIVEITPQFHDCASALNSWANTAARPELACSSSVISVLAVT